jgi:hypothetical protein
MLTVSMYSFLSVITPHESAIVIKKKKKLNNLNKTAIDQTEQDTFALQHMTVIIY